MQKILKVYSREERAFLSLGSAWVKIACSVLTCLYLHIVIQSLKHGKYLDDERISTTSTGKFFLQRPGVPESLNGFFVG